MITKKIFDIEYQYQFYLSKIGMIEAQMHPEQKLQLKDTFYGAFGIVLKLLVEEIGALEDDKANETIDSLMKQVSEYYVDRMKDEFKKDLTKGSN